MWAKIQITEGCWNWTGAIGKGGYGNFWWDGKYINAHRICYVLFVGPIPDGLHVCHRCDNRRCARPDHLFLGTRSDNMTDASRKGRTHRPLPKKCQRGHTNWYRNPNRGNHYCRDCQQMNAARYREKQRGYV